MPRWLWVLTVLILLAVFVLPDPAAAGTAVGNAIDGLVTFFRSFGTAATT